MAMVEVVGMVVMVLAGVEGVVGVGVEVVVVDGVVVVVVDGVMEVVLGVVGGHWSPWWRIITQLKERWWTWTLT